MIICRNPIPTFCVGLNNTISASKSIFYFDTDDFALPHNEIKEIANEYGISFFIIRANKGFHIISFDIMASSLMLSLWGKFKTLYPLADYKPHMLSDINFNTNLYRLLRSKREFRYLSTNFEMQLSDDLPILRTNHIFSTLRISQKTHLDSFVYKGAIRCNSTANSHRSIAYRHFLTFRRFWSMYYMEEPQLTELQLDFLKCYQFHEWRTNYDLYFVRYINPKYWDQVHNTINELKECGLC